MFIPPTLTDSSSSSHAELAILNANSSPLLTFSTWFTRGPLLPLLGAFSGFFVLQQKVKCPSFLHLLHISSLAGQSASLLMCLIRPHLKHFICDAACLLFGVCGWFVCLLPSLFILKSLIPTMLLACLSAVSWHLLFVLIGLKLVFCPFPTILFSNAMICTY